VSSGLEIDCQDLVELVTDYLDGVLPEVQQVRVRDHLDLCDGCAAYVEQLRETVGLVGRLSDELAPEFRTRLLSAFHDWKPADVPGSGLC
jgi:predicted anti-sigma-YlaC factor YlaD